MNNNKQENSTDCPIMTAQRILSGKWSIAILYYLGEGTLRFGELQRKLPFLTQSTLSRQLKELVTQKLVIRTDYQTIPPKVEYSLSKAGKEFIPIIKALEEWAERYEEFLEREL